MHKTYSHPIPVPLPAARRAPMSPLNAELVEFESWLETTLHLLGADGVLYARCVLSILRQTIDNGRLVGRRQSPDVLQNVTVVKTLGRDAVLSFPPGAVTAAVVGPLDPDADLASPGPRRLALIECLRTVELDERKLRELTDEILDRYAKVVKQSDNISGNASQNDSIDSGVCPSPVESDQNYDEAFPPLSDVENDDDDRGVAARARKTSMTVKKTSTAPVPIPTSSSWACSALTSNDNRINKSSANWACSNSSVSGSGDINSSSKCATSSTATKSSATLTPSASIGNDVLSSSLRASSIGNKLTAPFTREWATRSAELFGGGGIGRRSRHTSLSKGDGSVGATSNNVVSSSVPHRAVQHGVHHHLLQQQSLPHFVVARAPSTTAGGSKVFSSASKLEYNYSGMPGGRRSAVMLSGGGEVSSSFPTAGNDSPMAASSVGATLSSYDAPPRFILHNIKEHQPVVSSGRQQNNNCQSAMAAVKPVYHQPQPPVYFDAPMPDVTSLPGFGFDPWAEQKDRDSRHHRLQLDDPLGSLPNLLQPTTLGAEEDFFCMPRMEDVMDACHLPLPQPQPTAATFVDSVLQTDAGVKIPVSPDTHFVPIRSESMEEAYVPANAGGEDEIDGQPSYAIDFYGAERYFVLRNGVRSSPPAEIPVKRSLPIKFKAMRPEKHCQTNCSAEKNNEWVGTDEWRCSVVEAVIASSSEDDTDVNDTTPTRIASGSSLYIPEGDNTVALPDAWANTVWEPRLSIGSSTTEEERWPNEPGFRAVLQGNSRRLGRRAADDFNNDCNGDTNNIHPSADNNRNDEVRHSACDVNYDYRKPLGIPSDDDDDDILLRYVNNINLLSPLDSAYVAAV